ncbi:hypothetical protein [Mesobacillus zeae]|uniref:Uncharacterized protein n=1 Tax=Mesobacillus zeae TaxID=1917180 RepID=A0A398B9Q0_9BACI|nr:hypothetical protein [Mesobacillus zeae]RID85578.1 hypothetical protein D1970_08435 [Mesobacillus zeae]
MKWVLVFILCGISLLFLSKGAELWFTLGNPASISFLGVPINENVPKESVAGYALGFTVAAIIPVLVAVNIYFRAALKKKTKSTKL